MFSFASWKMGRVRQGLWALALGTAAASLSGCVSLSMPWANKDAADSHVAADSHAAAEVKTPGAPNPSNPPAVLTPMPAKAPVGQPNDICTYWDKEPRKAPDPTQHGLMVPCLVGRMIMFNAKGDALCCDGTMTVTLFALDNSPDSSGVALEHWTVDKDNMRKMINKDGMGLWGYSLALPTAAYRPEMTLIRMDIEFRPEHGNPMFASSGKIRMHSIYDTTSKHGLVTPGISGPGQMPLPQGGVPQVLQPQGMQPQVGLPQGMQPQVGLPQGMQPQGMQPQGMQPQGMQPQGMQPQGMQPQVGLPQGMQPQVNPQQIQR